MALRQPRGGAGGEDYTGGECIKGSPLKPLSFKKKKGREEKGGSLECRRSPDPKYQRTHQDPEILLGLLLCHTVAMILTLRVTEANTHSTAKVFI